MLRFEIGPMIRMTSHFSRLSDKLCFSLQIKKECHFIKNPFLKHSLGLKTQCIN